MAFGHLEETQRPKKNMEASYDLNREPSCCEVTVLATAPPCYTSFIIYDLNCKTNNELATKYFFSGNVLLQHYFICGFRVVLGFLSYSFVSFCNYECVLLSKNTGINRL